jgi:hypothetical protein
VVGSTADKLELRASKMIPRGNYLNETTVPVRTVIAARHDTVFGYNTFVPLPKLAEVDTGP